MNVKLMSFIAALSLGIVCIYGATRELRQLNDGWNFRRSDDSISNPVNLPHCWNEDAYYTRDYYRGKGIYSRDLRLSETSGNKRIILRLDGLATSGEIFIDSCRVGETIGGYSSHSFDITPYLKSAQPSKLTIIADNSRKDIPPYSADFTFMGGIYRDAWLMGMDDVHLDVLGGTEEGFNVKTSLLPTGEWNIESWGDIVNNGYKDVKALVKMTLSEEDGKSVASVSRTVEVKRDALESFRLTVSDLKDVRLWSPESPNLYRVKIDVSVDGHIVDSGSCLTAFRTFGFNDDGAFILNGSTYKLRGVCRHQDRWPAGIALLDEQHRQDMKLAKEMGANFVRISHYPQDEAVLEMCDRLGLIVWEEIPVIDYVPAIEGLEENSESMLRDMIHRHYNHPSVAMWGYMNEILLRVPEEDRQEAFERTLALARSLETTVREEDPDRLTTMAFHGSDVYHEAQLSDITDVKGWNLYQGWYGGRLQDFESFLSRQHREHPNHKLIVSEYGAGSDQRIHSFNPQPFDFSMEYQQKYLEHYLPVIEDSVFIAGASHWNLIDFSSANREESMPHINNKGILTNDRRKKDIYHYFSAKWHDVACDTVAHIAVDDWAERCDLIGDRGEVFHSIKVYSNLPSISVSVNGGQAALCKVDNCTATFDALLKDGKNILIASDPKTGKILDVAEIFLKGIPTVDGKLNLGDREFGVNVGSSCYFRSADTDIAWIPDREYADGSIFGYTDGYRETTTGEIALTADDPLLQTCMKGLTEYRFDVMPGEYEIELLFAELASPSEKSAYLLGHDMGVGESDWTNMDISINGVNVEKDFAPGVGSRGKTLIRRRYQTSALDSSIKIKFDRAKGTTHLSAIKIRQL